MLCRPVIRSFEPVPLLGLVGDTSCGLSQPKRLLRLASLRLDFSPLVFGQPAKRSRKGIHLSTNKVRVERQIGHAVLSIETGVLAKQAAGAVIVQYGDTVVLVATATGAPRPGTDFFPLTCDYRERTAAAGKFPGGFLKREGRPTMRETLTSRLMDRPIRPLFPVVL